MTVDFGEFVTVVAREASIPEVQAAIRATVGAHAAAWVADTEGLSRRQGRRWLSPTDYPRSREGRIRGLVSDAVVAAIRFGNITAIRYRTRVEVYYKGNPDKPEGTRPIPDLSVIDGSVADYLATAAQDLAGAHQVGAEDAFSDAVIAGYEDGLEDTLGVRDFAPIVVVSAPPAPDDGTGGEGGQDGSPSGPSTPPQDSGPDQPEPSALDEDGAEFGRDNDLDEVDWQTDEPEDLDDSFAGDQDADDEASPWATAVATEPDAKQLTLDVEPEQPPTQSPTEATSDGSAIGDEEPPAEDEPQEQTITKTLARSTVEQWLAEIERTLGQITGVDYTDVGNGRQKVTVRFIPFRRRR